MSSLYQLPEFNFPRLKKSNREVGFRKKFPKFWKNKKFAIVGCAVLILSVGIVGEFSFRDIGGRKLKPYFKN
jgi:hypothetical protein